MKIYNPTVSYTSVSVNLLQQLNARGGYPAGTDAPKSQSLPGLKFAPSAAASTIMRILMGSEGVTASANSTGNSLRMEIERYTHGENDHITQVRAAGSGDVDLAVVSSRKESISVVTAGGNDIIQVVGNRVSGVSGERGNDHIQIVGLASKKLDDHTVGFVSGDDGNDTIAIASRGEVDVVEGGDGNDAIAITAQGDVDRVSGGDGNDAIAISTAGYVLRLEGGDGNDAIAIAAGRDVNLIDGGDGRDTIAVSAKGSVSMLDGGDGDDVISISADDTSLIDGGDGNDTISVTAKWQAFASGGDGNDVLSLSGREVRAGGGDGNDALQLSGHDLMAVGGTGNDRIKLDSTSGQVATLRMAEGDGNDVVESNTSLNIARYSSDGTARLDPANATLAHNDDGTVTVSFEGSSDSVTVKFTGAMAGHEIGMRIENGNLVVGPANGQS